MAQVNVTAGTTERNALILAPSLIFEKLQDESPLDPAKFGAAALEKRLSAAANECLLSKGFNILAATNFPPEVATLIGKLQPMAGRAARGSLTAGSRAALADLASGLGPALILAQYLRVRVGGKWSWDPLYGDIRSSQMETLLAAALIDPANGTVVWKNEILARKVLSPDSKDLKDALSALYATVK